MPTVCLRAHFDGEHILLDEPFELPANSRLIVTVLPEEDSFDQGREEWFNPVAQGLSRASGDSEPEYTDADIIR